MTEIPFYKPSISAKEIELVNEVLTAQVQNVEQNLELQTNKYLNTKHSVSTNNATAAMHLSLCAMDLKRGDKIICSVNSFPAVAEVVRHFDAEPIFVDINKDDFNIDVKQFERTLRMHQHKKLKGAFITHIAGQAAELNQICELAKEYKIKIIDDATEAFGATYEKNKIGAYKSDISCFRFSQQTRNSIASGGILCTNDEEIANRARLLKNHAIVSDGWDNYGNLGYVYDVVDIGVKYDICELSAAYNIGVLEKLNSQIKRRQEIAAIYDKELADCPHIKTPAKTKEHIYTQYIIKVDKNRDSFAKELKEKGIYTALNFVPLHLLHYYKSKYSLKVNDFPVALANYQQILSIPIYDSLSDEMVMYICKCIKDIANTRV